MKKRIIYIGFLISILWSTSCTKDFEEINTDKNNLTEVGPREMPFMFAKAQSSSAMDRSFYQTVQNLGADLFAQYFALTTTSFRTDRYMLTPDWQRRFWQVIYVDTAPQLKSILENSEEGAGEAALANILWVYSFHRLVDHFGPVPYFDAAEAKEVIPYDAPEKIYDDFFKRLASAVSDLEALDGEAKIFEGYDLMFNGDVALWIKFANSLRLRLALRISLVDEERAKEEAVKAYQAEVMTNNADNAFLQKSLSGNDANGLAQVAEWNEFAMSSTIASYLKGYDDPRLEKFFQPSVATDTFNSLRNGSTSGDLGKARNQAAQNSNVGSYWVNYNGNVPQGNLTQPFHVMCAAESYFLRAEGALNGWEMGGTAEELYKKGIEISLAQWGVDDQSAINAYINSSNTPAAPGDYHNSPPVADTPIAWASDEEMQREQIGVQKWLAIFPNGMEAWAEQRRTGFPKLYDLIESENSDLPVGKFIRRLPYPLTEETNNMDELEKGRGLLDGPDNVATTLWWDVR